ncbi:MAG: ATP-binding protein [Terracidiphilus sp.]|jgi:signal transduction histidine kinase
MSEGKQKIVTEQVPLEEVAEALRHTLPFAETNFADLAGIGPVHRVMVPAGAIIEETWAPKHAYAVVLDGEMRADRPEPDGSRTTVSLARKGQGFGEAPMLMGKRHSPVIIEAVEDTRLVRFSEEDFWKLMACCPNFRKVVLADMAQRLQAHQVDALHREKLVSLGTLAAGLMHELHNPGSAAKRSASQLRINLLRLQELSLRHGAKPKTQLQLDCMHSLLEHAFRGCHAPSLSTVEQSDAEEAMSEWLQAAGVENAFTIGPALVEIGFDLRQLDCAKAAFERAEFSDALNWLGALISSVSLVCTIEESITRIADLVMAVKKFAYDEKSPAKELDVHDSLQSTLTILGHKLRIKNIQVEKDFGASPSTIRTRGSSLSQVWTNLIDNALDASPTNAKIKIGTWIEPGIEAESGSAAGPQRLAVSIEDYGAGIPPEAMPRIFEAFFTTKAQGSGTGLGLEIVHRIVTQKFGGTIDVESQPGNTRFIVRLPLEGPADCGNCLAPAR